MFKNKQKILEPFLPRRVSSLLLDPRQKRLLPQYALKISAKNQNFHVRLAVPPGPSRCLVPPTVPSNRVTEYYLKAHTLRNLCSKYLDLQGVHTRQVCQTYTKNTPPYPPVVTSVASRFRFPVEGSISRPCTARPFGNRGWFKTKRMVCKTDSFSSSNPFSHFSMSTP